MHVDLPIVITECERTTACAPTQWEGRTQNGEWFYARFRHAYFYAALGETLDGATFADQTYGSVLLMEATLEDEPQEMTDERMREVLGRRVQWAKEIGE